MKTLAGRFLILECLRPERTFRCQDGNRQVAVKLHPLAGLSEESLSRAQRDARLWPENLQCFLEGPHLLTVSPWLIGESVPIGEAHSPHLVVALARQTLAALRPFHSRGLIHGAICPTNLIGGQLSYAGPSSEHPESMAPEVAGSIRAAVDGRSDFYSLGVLLFAYLTGKLPFPGPTAADWLRQHSQDEPATTVLESLFRRLLAKDPRARYNDLEELELDLLLLESEPRRVLPGPKGQIMRPQLCGRGHERELLRRLLEKGPGVVLLEGPSGGGKTRLLEEVARDCPTALRLRASLEGSQTPLSALLPLTSLELGSWPEELRAHELALTEVLPELTAGPISAPTEEPEAFAVERSMSALRAWLSVIARKHPVLLLDDAQWLDPLSADLLSSWDRDPGANLVILMAARSLEPSPFEQREPQRKVLLEPLENEKIRQLITSMTADLPQETRDRLVRMSQGSPLLAVEGLHALVYGGMLIATRQGWIDAGTSEPEVSSPTGDLLARRLTLLPTPVRKILEIMATLGRSLDDALIKAVSPFTAQETAQALEQACQYQLVWREGFHFVFSHDRLREALQRQAGPNPDLFLQAAEILEHRKPPDSYRLAQFYFEAGRPERALPYCRHSAELARRRHALPTAEHFYRQALRLGGADRQMLRGLAETLILQGSNFEEAESLLEHLLATAKASLERADILQKLANLAYRRDRPGPASEFCRQGLAALGRPVPRGPQLTLAVLWRGLALGWKPRPTDYLAPAPDAEEQIATELLRRLCEASFETGAMQEQLYAHLEGVHSAQRHAPGAALGLHYAYHSVAAASYGRFARAHRYGTRALELLTDKGTRHDLAIGLQWCGISWYYMGRLDEAERALRESSRGLERSGDLWEKAFVDSVLLSCLYSQGRLPEVLTLGKELSQRAHPQAAARALHYLARALGAGLPEGLALRETERPDTGAFHRLEAWQAWGCQLLGCGQYREAARAFETALKAGGGLHALTCHIPASLASCWRLAFDADGGSEVLAMADLWARKAISAGKKFPLCCAHSFREAALWAARRGHTNESKRWLIRSKQSAVEFGLRFELVQCLFEGARLGRALGWGNWQQDQAQAEVLLEQLGVDWPVPGFSAPRRREDVRATLRYRFGTLLEQGRRLTRALQEGEVRRLGAEALAQLTWAQECQLLPNEEEPTVQIENLSDGRRQLRLPVRVEGKVRGWLCGVGLLDEDSLALGEFAANLTGAAWENALLLERERAMELSFRRIFEGAGVGLLLVDTRATIVQANPVAARLLGADCQGASFLDQLWPTDRKSERKRFQSLLLGKQNSYQAELRHRRDSGLPAWLLVDMVALGGGQYLRVLQDVSQTRLTEIVRFQESEQLVLSLDLHDGLAQELVAMQLHAEDPGAIRQLAGTACEQLRELIRTLRNPLVTGGKPLEAIETLVLSSEPVQVELQLSGGKVPWLTGIFLYRIVQEALRNAQKHAQASSIWVHIRCRRGSVRAHIGDNGVGLPPQAGSLRMGLRGIRQRVRLLGGRLRIRSHGGVKIDFILPWREELI